MCLEKLRFWISRYAVDDGGSATVWSISWSLIFLIIGGLSIDASSAFKSQEELQTAADAASHAGAVELDPLSDASAKQEATRIALENFPQSIFGIVLASADVQTGNWDNDTRTFSATTVGADAVRVLTRRMASNNNAVPTFLLRLIGFNSWDIVARSTTQRFIPGCIMDGVVAVGTAEISSNNSFRAGYCIHGQAGVKISSNNFFEGPSGTTPGVRVSMNDLADLQLPGSGFATNTGLADALGEDWMYPRAVGSIATEHASLGNPTTATRPSFITNNTPISLTKSTFDAAALTAGNVYNVSCSGNQQITIAGVTVSNVVITTNCRVKFGSGAALENAIISTSSTTGNSIQASSGLRVGVDDNCAAGGGATLMTAGGISIASGLEAYGSQFITGGDVNISAQANGIEGASFKVGGNFKMTSNGVMGNCIGNVDQLLTENYYRIVE